ncbi:MAG: hypothetical protein ACYC7E_07890 [Armatimonadota bacterium]
MMVPAHEITLTRWQRFYRAYYAAFLTVLALKAFPAVMAPEGVGAVIWSQPLRLLLLISWIALLLAPISLLNILVYLRPIEKIRASWWHHPLLWLVWLLYGTALLGGIYYIAAHGVLLRTISTSLEIIVVTALTVFFHQAARPHHVFFGLAAIAIPIYLSILLYPSPPIDANTPLVWTTGNDTVYLQWQGKNYEISGMSPTFTTRRRELCTLEERDLVVTPISGKPLRINLKPRIPNMKVVQSIQPYPDGVMLNLFDTFTSEYSVAHVILATGKVRQLPRALRVVCAATTNQYYVREEIEEPHVIRSSDNIVIRRHGLYPWHYSEWSADPTEGLLAIMGRTEAALIGPDMISMVTFNPGTRIVSATLQPASHQIWLAEDTRDRMNELFPPCRLFIYAYNGRFLGSRTVYGSDVRRVVPIDEAMAQLLVRKYRAEELEIKHPRREGD